MTLTRLINVHACPCFVAYLVQDGVRSTLQTSDVLHPATDPTSNNRESDVVTPEKAMQADMSAVDLKEDS